MDETLIADKNMILPGSHDTGSFQAVAAQSVTTPNPQAEQFNILFTLDSPLGPKAISELVNFGQILPNTLVATLNKSLVSNTANYWWQAKNLEEFGMYEIHSYIQEWYYWPSEINLLTNQTKQESF